jgi:hypothetical protein
MGSDSFAYSKSIWMPENCSMTAGAANTDTYITIAHAMPQGQSY